MLSFVGINMKYALGNVILLSMCSGVALLVTGVT